MNSMRFSIATLFLALPCAAFAASTLDLGEAGTVAYTDMRADGGVTLYYDGDVLVASAHDTSGDGTPDVWLQYRDDSAVLEGHDTDADGTPDAFFVLNQNEEVTRQYGAGHDVFTPPDAETFESLIAEGSEDLVGDIDRIRIPGGGPGVVTWGILLLVLVGGGAWWVRWKKRT